jgi:hypothetical protein
MIDDLKGVLGVKWVLGDRDRDTDKDRDKDIDICDLPTGLVLGPDKPII